MNNLFALFDPVVWSGPWLWLAILAPLPLVPGHFWLHQSPQLLSLKEVLKGLEAQMNDPMRPLAHPGTPHWAISMMMLIMIMNLLGLMPYVFTPTSHLSFTLSLGLTFWSGYFLYSLTKAPTFNLSHLVPSGTPPILQPFMVLVESVSSLIRPLTLSVRLAANMVAGHLLIALITQLPSIAGLLIGGTALMVLESLVALVQGYVFTLLSILYFAESNTPSKNF